MRLFVGSLQPVGGLIRDESLQGKGVQARFLQHTGIDDCGAKMSTGGVVQDFGDSLHPLGRQLSQIIQPVVDRLHQFALFRPGPPFFSAWRNL